MRLLIYLVCIFLSSPGLAQNSVGLEIIIDQSENSQLGTLGAMTQRLIDALSDARDQVPLLVSKNVAKNALIAERNPEHFAQLVVTSFSKNKEWEIYNVKDTQFLPIAAKGVIEEYKEKYLAMNLKQK